MQPAVTKPGWLSWRLVGRRRLTRIQAHMQKTSTILEQEFRELTEIICEGQIHSGVYRVAPATKNEPTPIVWLEP